MKRALLASVTILTTGAAVWAACGYFGPDGKRPVGMRLQPPVTQPGQRAFVTWDKEKATESFTVQPDFKGNAKDFGMVIPTPNRPKLQEMPKDFFAALDTFTTLLPVDRSKFRMPPPRPMSAAQGVSKAESAGRSAPPPAVKILERGIVGTLDYKILEADRSDALINWLKDHRYSYKGQEATLDYYVKKHWYFTVMKIDSRNMKKRADGTFLGEVTPSRFTFKVAKPIYPLRITQGSVVDSTDVQIYLMSDKKMDFGGTWSFEPNFWWRWKKSMAMAYPEKLTAEDKRWLGRVGNWNPRVAPSGARLEWAGKLTPQRLESLQAAVVSRPGPGSVRAPLTILRGHLKTGWTLTKIRKSFQRAEMSKDIDLLPATVEQYEDDLEFVSDLPVSDPNQPVASRAVLLED